MAPPPDTPELKTLKKVIDRLDRGNIAYMLTGSMALNFYGHPRATNDFDVVIEMEKGGGDRFLSLFENDYYVSREAFQEAMDGEGLFNIIDQESVFKIDLIVKKKDAFSAEQFRRRRLEKFAGFRIYVISPEDLVLSKLQWSRESLSEVQERDVKNLMSLLAKTLDYAYLEKWADWIGQSERLKRFYVQI